MRHVLSQYSEFPINQETLALLPRILDRPYSIEADGTSRGGYPIVRFTRRFGAQIYTVSLEIQGNKHRMLEVQNMWGRTASTGSRT